MTGLHNVVFGTDYPYPHDDISIGGLRIAANARPSSPTRSGRPFSPGAPHSCFRA